MVLFDLKTMSIVDLTKYPLFNNQQGQRSVDEKLKTSILIFKKLQKNAGKEYLKNVKFSLTCDPYFRDVYQSCQPLLKNPRTISEGLIKKDVHKWVTMTKYIDDEFNGKIILGCFGPAFDLLSVQFTLHERFRNICTQILHVENFDPIYRLCMNCAKVLCVLGCYNEAVEYCDVAADPKDSVDESRRKFLRNICESRRENTLKLATGANDEPTEEEKSLYPHDRKRFRLKVKQLTEKILSSDTYKKQVNCLVELDNEILGKQIDSAKVVFDSYFKTFLDGSAGQSVKGNPTVSGKKVAHNKPEISMKKEGKQLSEASSTVEKVNATASIEVSRQKKKKKRKDKKKTDEMQASFADESKPTEFVLNAETKKLISQLVAEQVKDFKEEYNNDSVFASSNKFKILSNDTQMESKNIQRNSDVKNKDFASNVVNTIKDVAGKEIKENLVFQVDNNGTNNANDKASISEYKNISDSSLKPSLDKDSVINDLSVRINRDENNSVSENSYSDIDSGFKSKGQNRLVFDVIDLYESCPLLRSYDFFLGCITCHKSSPGVVFLTIHRCKRDVLLCREKNCNRGLIWSKVRPNQQKNFGGFIDRCLYYPNCPHGDSCSFAHSELECLIWTEESESRKFFITSSFINDLSRSVVLSSPRKRNIANLGTINIWVGCAECCTLICNGLFSLTMFRHHCEMDKLFCRDKFELWVLIRPRYKYAKSISICWHLQSTAGCFVGESCHFPHSELEKQLWMLDERKELDLVAMINEEKKYWRLNGPEFRCVSNSHNFRNNNSDVKKSISPMPHVDYTDNLDIVKIKTKIIGPFANTEPVATVRLSAENKMRKFCWVFEIESKVVLKRVFLLEARFFHVFGLSSTQSDVINSAYSYGDAFMKTSDIKSFSYEVRLEFLGSVSLGSFAQSVVFDFGSSPMLRKNVHVLVGLQELQLYRLSRLKDLLNTNNYWTQDNCEIIWISGERDYKPPTSMEIISNWRYEINETTYFSMLKKWITAEEMRRRAILSKFHLTSDAKLNVVFHAENDRVIKAFPEGALFAEIQFDQPLTEEFDVTDLLLGYCQNAFVAVAEANKQRSSVKRRVYEAYVVCRANFNCESVTQNSVVLCLSAVFVRHANLRSGQSVALDVQFNIRHKDFTAWHFALDILIERKFTQCIFPDLLGLYTAYTKGVLFLESVSKFPQIGQLESRWVSEGKNEEQCAVLRHVVVCALNNTHPVPPFVIFGPFGTGKTRTMAEAAATLLTTDYLANTKILICAHSNNTADMYIALIEKYTGFDANKLREIVWRIFPRKTTRDSLPMFLRPYFRAADETNRKQLKLTIETFLKMRIVICTSSGAHTLVKLSKYHPKLANFTHIFLDEAAQALEIETLMPLCTAVKTTCVIAAGDPHQLKPTVYLTECSQLACSYLERLYHFYESKEALVRKLCGSNVCFPKVFFNKVYRCQPDILEFVSKSFYGNLNLICLAENRQTAFQSVYFASAFGEDKLLPHSISYSNNIEVIEVMAQVEYFYKNWPDAWGERDIGIAVVPYDQMRLIQEQLRIKGYPQMHVKCTKVVLSQGREFKVLIVSTVRGRSILNGAPYQKGKLGFLDDPRLINTALTRARYCVVVVGDPIALCSSIGVCRDYWRRYVKFCFDRKTFLPEKYSFELIKQYVEEADAKLASMKQNE